MTNVMNQGERFGKFPVQAEGLGQGARDLGYFKRVGEAAAKMIAGRIAGQAREDLRLARKASERAGVEDARSVPGECSAVRMRALGIYALSEGALELSADSDVGGQRGG
jgi:hypothetical protein